MLLKIHSNYDHARSVRKMHNQLKVEVAILGSFYTLNGQTVRVHSLHTMTI